VTDGEGYSNTHRKESRLKRDEEDIQRDQERERERERERDVGNNENSFGQHSFKDIPEVNAMRRHDRESEGL
jgi:hypothetical protein